jgi:hypothetical protein
MKKDFIADQTITIKIPADPTRPAEVVFTPGPYADEAKRLAKIPGSGWKEGPDVMDLLVEALSKLSQQELLDLTPAPVPIIVPKNYEAPTVFLVDRRVLTPKPLRKSRPDASKRMSAYNKAKKPRPQE